jgi:hypothetical protein
LRSTAPWTRSTEFSIEKLNPKIGYFGNFAKRPLGFFEINP